LGSNSFIVSTLLESLGIVQAFEESMMVDPIGLSPPTIIGVTFLAIREMGLSSFSEKPELFGQKCVK
jgi:hypothetical protein